MKLYNDSECKISAMDNLFVNVSGKGSRSVSSVPISSDHLAVSVVGGAAAVPDMAQGPELGNIIRMMNVAPDCDGWNLARNQPLLECLSFNIDTQMI